MKQFPYKLFFSMMILAVLLAGCGGEDAPSGAGSGSSAAQSMPAEGGASSSEAPGPSPVVFEGQDMDGNPVTSEIFSQSKLTMVNVWATYCNPCLSEMPGLGELAGEYELEQFQIIGIVSDVLEGGDQEDFSLAAELIEQTGANYTHLLLNESIYYAMLTDVSAVPTTFFVDENGVILDTVVNAYPKSAWEEMVHGFLEER